MSIDQLEEELSKRMASLDVVPAEDHPSSPEEIVPTPDFPQDNE
jgi:hypothetical protein